MEGNYLVTAGSKQVGKVSVFRKGLYYYFSCRCCLSAGTIYRLVVSCGSTRQNLGVLVPSEDSFVLETKLPVKRIGKGDLSFSLTPKQDSFSGTFVPISPEEPFAYISRLKQSFLVIRNGQPGIMINKMQEL